MAKHLISSDASIKAIKQGDPRHRLNDGNGLYLRLFVNGGSHGWRFDYTFRGRRNTLSFGTYPVTTLAFARRQADDARRKVREGIDPSAERQAARAELVQKRVDEKRLEAGLPAVDSFEFVAKEWFDKHSPGWATSHSEKVIRRLERDVFPWLGARPIKTITPMDVLAVLRRVEARGVFETAHRVHQNCGQVFRYAVATGRMESDPSRDLRGALTPWKPEHYPAITEPRVVGQLLRDIDQGEAGFITRCAMQLAPLLFVRPGELRRAEWREIDLETAEWRIPPEKMKAGELHIVPLSRQAIAIFRELEPLTGSGKWVFPSVRNDGQPMSENTINAALRRLGYTKATITAHGFRTTASTILHERGWPTDVIERQLSHAERNEVKAAYNRAEHLPERRLMMQAWSDYLDELRQDKTAQGAHPVRTDAGLSKVWTSREGLEAKSSRAKSPETC